MSSNDQENDQEKKPEPTSKNSDDWAEALQEQASAEAQKPQGQAQPSPTKEHNRRDNPGPQANTIPLDQADQIPAFENLRDNPLNHDNTSHDLSLIMDIPIQVTVELGHAKIEIRNLLNLSHGSIIELEGVAGDPMDVLVNGCLIAQGEIVVINEHFGIRLTDIITPLERIKRLSRML